MKHTFERYCKDYENIENYQKAKKDDFKGWHCHHRLETHNSDGERRLVDISHNELKALGMYYNRPADELIFLTSREHNAFKKGKPAWNRGKHTSDETRKKISEGNKGKQAGEKHPMYGKKHSDEARRKMSELHKGKNKGNTNTKGMHWYNNGKINKVCYECPEGFTPGRLR